MHLPPTEIAIIVITYQSADHIQACLYSLPNAEPERRLKIILIDNASTDGTTEIIARAIQLISTPRIQTQFIQNRANLGFTRALNQGLAQCPKNAAVLFLNPDTELPPNSLTLLYDRLYALNDVGVIAPQLRFPPAHLQKKKNAIQPSCRRFPAYRDLFFEMTGLSRMFPNSAILNRWKMGNFDHRTSKEVDQPQGACLLVRPQVIEQIGNWDERFPIFFSDVDWCLRVRQAGWKIRFESSVKIYHHLGASVKQVRPKAIWSSHISCWKYFRKHADAWHRSLLSLAAGPIFFLTAIIRIVCYYLFNPIRKLAPEK